METVPHTPHWLATRRTLSGIAALAVGTALFLAGGTASATVTIPADPGAEPAPVDPSTQTSGSWSAPMCWAGAKEQRAQPRRRLTDDLGGVAFPW